MVLCWICANLKPVYRDHKNERRYFKANVVVVAVGVAVGVAVDVGVVVGVAVAVDVGVAVGVGVVVGEFITLSTHWRYA